jgi:uncharacterized protein (DUF1330 family)
MSAYVIFQGDVSSEAVYEQYKEMAAATVAAHGGTYLVRGGAWTALEGAEPASRTVIIQFASVDAARDWYNSAEYVAARPMRQAASDGALYIVDG